MTSVRRPLEMAREWIRAVVQPGDFVVDGTLGNGHDTLFLAECVGPAGRVLGFDVQDAAVRATRARLRDAGIEDDRVDLRCQCHGTLAETETSEVAAAMFNFGYLPGGDKAVITRPETSVVAVRTVVDRLRVGGAVTLMCYPGHPGGAEDTAAVEAFAASLDPQEYRVVRYAELAGGQRPFLIGVERAATTDLG